jgi:hypothetical protein
MDMPRSIRSLFLVALAVLAVTQSARADFIFNFGGHSYEFVQQGRTWTGAATDATSRSLAGAPGALAVIDSAEENQAIEDAVLANLPASTFPSTRAADGGNRSYFWIAGTDRVTEGAWIWDADGNGAGSQFWQGTGTGGPVGGAFTNWGTFGIVQREPDNSQNAQDALGFSLEGWPFGFAGEWNDVNEGNALYYLVEYTPVPEPSTIALLITGFGALLVVQLRRRWS